MLPKMTQPMTMIWMDMMRFMEIWGKYDDVKNYDEKTFFFLFLLRVYEMVR